MQDDGHTHECTSSLTNMDANLERAGSRQRHLSTAEVHVCRHNKNGQGLETLTCTCCLFLTSDGKRAEQRKSWKVSSQLACCTSHRPNLVGVQSEPHVFSKLSIWYTEMH